MFEQKNLVIDLADCAEANCRMCLKRFKEYDLRLKITDDVKQNFERLVNIELKLLPIYPQYICMTCHNQLARFAHYRQNIIQRQDLISIFNGQKVYVDSTSPNEIIAKVIEENNEQEHPEYKFLVPNQGIYEIDIDPGQEESRNQMQPSTSTVHEEITEKKKESKVKIKNEIFKCEFCLKIFMRQRTLNEHRDKIHFKLINFVCDVCGYGAYRKYDLKRHIRTHIIKAYRQTYVCNICDSSLLSPEGLKRHIKKMHATTKNFFCIHCDEKFFRLNELNSHMDYIHGTKTFFACKYCNDFYGTTYSLRKHKMVCPQKDIKLEVINYKQN